MLLSAPTGWVEMVEVNPPRLPSMTHLELRTAGSDLSDIDASVGTHTVGQSGHPASPHFRDFVELWSKGEYHPLPFARDKVDQVTESTLRLTPR